MKKSTGQLLIEALIALGVGTTIVVAVGQLVGISFRANLIGANQIPSSGLTQECLEAALSIKTENWANLYFPQGGSDPEAGKGLGNPYHPIVQSSGWRLAPGNETISLTGKNYTRNLMIENVSRTAQNGLGEIEEIYNQSRRDLGTIKITCTTSFLGGEIKEARFLTRHNQKVFSQSNWQGGPGQANWSDPTKYFADNGGVNVTGTPGSVLLAGSPGGGYISKNEFLTSSIYGINPMNNNRIKTSLRFSAQANKQVQRVGIYLQTVRNSPTYRIGLQADSTGNPSGTWLGATRRGYGSFRPTTTGWQTINLTEAVPLTAGTVYHLVIEYQSGSIGGSRYIDLRSSLPLNRLIPFNNASDQFANTLYYSGRNWQIRGRQPIYYLGYADSSLEGNPYDNLYNPINNNFTETPIYGSNFVGQSFVGLTGTLSKIEISVRKSRAQNPQGDLSVSLYNLTDSQLINSGVLVGRNVVTQTYAWYTYTLPSPVTLASAKTYLVYLSSPATTSARAYNISAAIANTPLVPITFLGNQSQLAWSTNSGLNFTLRPEADFSTIRLLSLGGYVTSGELISSSFDTGSQSGYLSILWTGDKPANTDILFQIATNDNNATWNFLGPDGTTSTYYNISATAIFSGASNHRYLRYRLLLTSDGQKTPRLDEIRINYVL